MGSAKPTDPTLAKLYRGAKMGYKVYKSYTKLTQRKGASSQGAITQHRDNRTLYVRKRMPAKRRRAWTNFKRKVNWVNTSSTPRNTLVHSDLIKPTCSADQQAVCTLSLYPMFYTGDNSLHDVQKCMSIAEQSATESDLIPSYYAFRSAVLEATVLNRSDKTIYADVYWCYAKRSTQDPPQTLFGYGLRTTATTGADNAPSAIGTACTENTLGVTPFQSGLFSQHYTIQKKTRYMLGPGEPVQLEWRDPKNHYLKPESLEMSNNYPVKAGWTKTWVMVFYTTPDATNKAAAIASGDIAITRYVNYIFSPETSRGAQKFVAEY